MEPAVREKLLSIPREPGVYLFKDAAGDVIYVGKARNLRTRMQSYASGRDGRPLADHLIKAIADADFVVTSNEKEALVLENNFIKKYRPYYNIDLKDDKNFLSLMIDRSHDFPSIRLVRKIERENRPCADYFGPYHSSAELKDVLRFITYVFPVRNCSDSKFGSSKRPCLRHQIEKCSGPCCGKIDRESYARLLENFIDFLKGKNRLILSDMKKQIREYSGRLEFEKAEQLHKRLTALEGMFEKQSVVFSRDISADACGVASEAGGGAFLVQILHIRHGILVSQEKKFFAKQAGDIREALESFFLNYYENNPFLPEAVLVPVKINFKILAEELSRLHGRKVAFLCPARGKNMELLELAQKNAEIKLKEEIDSSRKLKELISKMQKKLLLNNPPVTIECFDVSSIQGQSSVASKVRFHGFMPDTSGYRRYSLQDIAENDDYLKISTVIRRRVLKGIERGDLPDLIVVDGGLGHLQAVEKMLKGISCHPEVIAIAKDRSHAGSRNDKIYIRNRKNPVVFQSSEKDVLYQIMRIRNEAHRFAIAYHRLKRKKKLFEK